MNHMVIDLETLGMDVIVQIGAVVFDYETFKEVDSLDLNVDFFSQVHNGGTLDPGMVKFWLDNADIITWLDEQNHIGVRNAFKELRKLVEFHKVQRIWCHDFDMKVIENVSKRYGIKMPFRFNQRLDLRTLVFLADYQIDFDNESGYQKTHKAIDDTRFELAYLKECIKKIREYG